MPTDRARAVESTLARLRGPLGRAAAQLLQRPDGPNLKRQWTEPIAWAEETWRDDSFAVPAGHSFGPTATGFFCGAVAAGSNLLTRATANPVPVVLTLLALVALAIWIATRTSWARSAPLRIARRRRLGGGRHPATWAMWRAHRALFVAIGVLFVPLSIVITLLQYVLFQVVALAPLADAVGESNAFVAGPP